jgi:ribosomal protein L36
MNRFWLSYDLGFQGEYGPLYVWLDKAKARECGDSVATFQSGQTREQVAKDLHRVVRREGRLYLIGKNKDGKFVGGFISGGRKSSPWVGFADNTSEAGEEE